MHSSLDWSFVYNTWWLSGGPKIVDLPSRVSQLSPDQTAVFSCSAHGHRERRLPQHRHCDEAECVGARLLWLLFYM